MKYPSLSLHGMLTWHNEIIKFHMEQTTSAYLHPINQVINF